MRIAVAACVFVLITSCAERETNTYTDSARIDSLHIASVLGDSVLVKEIITYDFSSFIPERFVLKDSVVGDLNLDKYPDAILLLIHDDEEWMDERARPMLILTGDSTGKFQLAVRNDYLTSPKVGGQMFGEPYAGMEIDSGTFTIFHYGGSRFRWTYDYVFEYDPEKKTWFYVKNYATMGDMLGEMNDLDSTGNCIPYERDTLILKRRIDVRKFDISTAEVAELE